MFRALGLPGLAIASDIGIFAQTAALALLLHKKRLVSLAHLEFAELARSGVAAVLAFLAAMLLVRAMPEATTHRADFATIAAGTIVWAVAALATLHFSGSRLPNQILRRGKV